MHSEKLLPPGRSPSPHNSEITTAQRLHPRSPRAAPRRQMRCPASAQASQPQPLQLPSLLLVLAMCVPRPPPPAAAFADSLDELMPTPYLLVCVLNAGIVDSASMRTLGSHFAERFSDERYRTWRVCFLDYSHQADIRPRARQCLVTAGSRLPHPVPTPNHPPCSDRERGQAAHPSRAARAASLVPVRCRAQGEAAGRLLGPGAQRDSWHIIR